METRLNTRTDRLEQSMIGRFVKMDERFEHVDERFKEVHTRLTGLKDDIAEQFERVKIQFEEVRADLRFGLEGRESLCEVMERFEEARERNEAQYELLTQVLHHVRGRVENLERGRNTL